MKNIFIAAAAYLALTLLSFYSSIILRHGPAESAHDPASGWLYLRRLLMIAGAFVLPAVTGSGAVSRYGWSVSLKWIGGAVAIGIIMGFGNKGGFDPRQATALVLACFHAFATESFFRCYLITTLSGVTEKAWPPILISSVLYGLFYLSVWTVWQQQPVARLFFVCLFTLLGLVFGYCYKKSQSLYVPWIMHFFAVLQYPALLAALK